MVFDIYLICLVILRLSEKNVLYRRTMMSTIIQI